MVGEHYDYLPSNRLTYFSFKSLGPKGTIHKIVRFTHMDEDVWNLGFGDLRKGKLDTEVVSNNQDLVKVISTVAELVRVFLQKYPERTIQIVPVDFKRKKLYNAVFARHWHEIRPQFYVMGLLNEHWEPYSPDEFFDEFRLFLKL